MAVSRKSKIYFFFEQSARLDNRAKLKRFIEGIFKKEKRSLLRLNYIFCKDRNLLAINQEYLKHDYYTDIVTFELSEGSDPIEGEVYISIDRVIANALSFKESRKKELHRVMIHGALHLCGYRDKARSEKEAMKRKEDFYLGLYWKRST